MSEFVNVLPTTSEEQKVLGELQRLTGCTDTANVLRVALHHLAKFQGMRVSPEVFKQR